MHVEPGLTVTFAVDGPMQVPAQGTARFADGLWQHTCFEVFVSRPGMPAYQEFNLSPSGEWAAYAFSGYREGMTRLDARPRLSVEKSLYRVQIDLPGPVLLGICAVIEDEAGRLSYWALRHPAGKPDFHHPYAFALAVP